MLSAAAKHSAPSANHIKTTNLWILNDPWTTHKEIAKTPAKENLINSILSFLSKQWSSNFSLKSKISHKYQQQWNNSLYEWSYMSAMIKS